MKVLTALNRALNGVILDDRDIAIVELAKHYARSIDRNQDMDWHVGPRLLDALIELGMTPKARASVLHGGPGGKDDGAGDSPLDELRNRRQRSAAP
jgi:hypothetical protein